MIKLENISKKYPPNLNVLKNVSLTIEKGEFIAITGKSGSGKSTLVNIIGCLDTACSGKLIFDSKDISTLPANDLSEIRLKKIGFVFQNFNLIARMNVVRNIELPMFYASVSRANRRARAMELLSWVGLKDKALCAPVKLSGGEQQRVAIARSLINSPEIIIADEPTGSLDTNTSFEIMKIFCDLNKQGKTIIIVTHDHQVSSYAHRIIKMQDGNII